MSKSEKEKYIETSLKDMVKEHKRLTGVLKNPTKASLKRELKIQTNELNKYLSGQGD